MGRTRRSTRGIAQTAFDPRIRLPGSTELTLRRLNPWWHDNSRPIVPHHRRHLVSQIYRQIKNRLAPIVVVRGARQVGKTTAQLQVLDDLLTQGVPGNNIFRVQFDDIQGIQSLEDPVLRLVDWYEMAILGSNLNDAARRGQQTFLFFDEVQNINNWAPQLKTLVDSSTTQVIVTGSSALRIELGRDSLAGRITTIEAGILSLTEIALIRNISIGDPFLPDNGLGVLIQREFWEELKQYGKNRRQARDEVFRMFSERGGYPIAHVRPDVPWPEIADQLNENVIRRVVQHDLRVGARGRKRDAALIEELFRSVCRYAGQAPALHSLAEEIRKRLGASFGDLRVRNYLKFLSDSLLVRTIEPLEQRLKKRRGNIKLCLADHALRASWLQENVPLLRSDQRDPSQSTLAGHIAESICGSMLLTIRGLDLNHLPSGRGQDEIDFILTVGSHRIPVEVKYQARPDPVRDSSALRAFINNRMNNAPLGILVTQEDCDLDFGPQIVAMPLSSLLLLR